MLAVHACHFRLIAALRHTAAITVLNLQLVVAALVPCSFRLRRPPILQVSNGTTVTMRRSSSSSTRKDTRGRWSGMDAGNDASDDQQDISRGREMVDSLFQGGQGMGGTHNAILSSQDYLSTVSPHVHACVAEALPASVWRSATSAALACYLASQPCCPFRLLAAHLLVRD
jgi:hypothetical protein